MRPNAAFEAGVGPRRQSIDRAAPSPGPRTFFLASESDLDRRRSTVSIPQEETPVRTPKQTVEEADATHSSPTKAHTHDRRDGSRRRSTIRPRSNEELKHEAIRQQIPQVQSIDASGGSTPALPSSQEPSLPSSPKSVSSRSLPKSDGDLTQDDAGSQAVESGDEDDATHQLGLSHDSAPQLIMPSIRMPSRRPFTDRGKQLGKFKIMVVGPRGSGKTSLIKSIVQLCEDIVHVDPLTSNAPPKLRLQSKSTDNRFYETYASTRPYPAWWSDIEDSRILKRRKSMGDSVLERNLCFVDTSHASSPRSAAKYIEQQLIKTINCANQANSELTGLLSGSGGSQVDLVLYLVCYESLQDDIAHLDEFPSTTNIVPLISKSDLLTAEQVQEIKTSFSPKIYSVPRLPISFGLQTGEAVATAPYTVACVNGPDYDNMDASLLMASEYVQPLLPSELHLLINQILEPDNASYLRHLAAKKLISWYNSGSHLAESLRTPSPASVRMRSTAPSTLNSPLQASLSASGVLVPITSHSELSLNTSNSFALAKIADHTHREERLAQVRLSKWASDLQLSLQRERERYENIARSERAVWLVERIGEEVRDGQLVPVLGDQVEEAEKGKMGPKARRRMYREGTTGYQVHDPLGLLRWQDTVRAQTWLALQVIGSFGVVGGLALFVTKACGYETSFHQWARDWGISFG